MNTPLAGDRPLQAARVLNPRCHVPVSLIIDDSTCLVNLAHYCIPPFAEVFPDQYKQNWRELPREIPDSFVLEFVKWCREHGIKGKYSIVPYPACVGWIDRELPGWSRSQLDASLEVVRRHVTPDWDIHPEMISHTWVIDIKTGRPYTDRSPQFMENWNWTTGRSTDELADYMSYALSILHNAGLPCEGITTPGGFGNRALYSLAEGTMNACRSVYNTEVPHYFRHIYTGEESVAPKVEFASGLTGSDPRCVVSMIGCTGDWFGGWDGLTPGSADRCISEDLASGRLPKVISRGEPAVIVCHWPGIYYNGEKVGFNIFKQVVSRLEAAYRNILWMKLSEIARYWAARELTSIAVTAGAIVFNAPFAAPSFTVELKSPGSEPVLIHKGKAKRLGEVRNPLALVAGTWARENDSMIVCFDLPRGASEIRFGSPHPQSRPVKRIATEQVN